MKAPSLMQHEKTLSSLSTVIAIITAVGTFIALVYKYIRKVDQLETNDREREKDLAKLTGTVEAQQQSLNQINTQLAGITARLDMLLGAQPFLPRPPHE